MGVWVHTIISSYPHATLTLTGITRRLDALQVFHDREGRRYKDAKTAFQAALKRARIGDFRVHDLPRAA